MATRSAGRVTIRVIPDSTGFRADLKKALERVEKTTKAVIPAELAVTRESIAKLRAQLRELEVRIKVEPYVTQQDIHDLKKKIEDIDPDVHVGLNTALARARLAAISRPRQVSLFVRVNKASLAAAATALAALSGTRFLGNVFDKFFDSIKNLDKTAPKILTITSALTGLVGILGAGVSNVFALGASLAQLGQLSVLFPALMTSAGISIGVLVAVLKDMKTVLADLGPSFTKLQDRMSAEFWKIAADPIRDLTRTVLPHLGEQLIKTSQAWGRMFKITAEGLKEVLTPKYLDQVFDNMNQGIDKANGGIKPLIQAFATLGLVGTTYLPRLGQWLTDLSVRFNNFIQRSNANGDLARWAEQGIQAFKDLGRVIANATRVLAAFARAAQNAGGSGLAQLADGLGNLAKTMNTPAFQSALSTILFATHNVVDGLIDGLNRLGPGLANFAPTIARVFSEVGKILGQFGEDIGTLLSTPELQDGLVRMFSGFLTFLTDLKPAMQPLGRIIGVVADAVGTLLSNFGLIIGTIAPYAATFFEELWVAIKPLIPVLTDLVQELIPPLAEIFLTLAREVLPELIPIIKELAPIFVDLVKALSPVIVQFLKDFGRGLEVAAPFIKDFARGLKDLTGAFEGLPLAFYQLKTGDEAGFLGTMMKFMKEHPTAAAFLTGVGQSLTLIGDVVKQFTSGAVVIDFLLNLGAALTQPANIIEGVVNLAAAIGTLNSMKGGWDAFWQGVGAILGIISPIGPAVKIMGDTIVTAVQVVTGLKPAWDGFWMLFHNPVQLAMTLVLGVVNLQFPSIRQAVVLGFAQILTFWQTNWPQLIPTVVSSLANVAASVTGGFPAIVISIITGMLRISQEWARGWMNILREVPGWFQRIGAGISAGIAIAVGIMMGLPPRLLGTLGGLAGDFYAKGVALLQNFAAGITAGGFSAIAAVGAVVGRIVAQLPGSPAKVGPLSGQGWSKIRGQHLAEDLAAGMRSRTGAVQSASLDMSRAAAPDGFGASWASAESVVATSGAAPLVNIEGDYYGATPEEVSEDFDKKIRRANTVYKLTGVK